MCIRDSIYAGRCVEPNAESVRFKLHQYGQLKPLVKCVVDTYDSLPRSLIERIRKMSQARAEASIASTAEIRAQFPALERVHNSYPVAYFDGPGGTQVPRR